MARPLAGDSWYSQEGATISQFDGSSIVGGVVTLSTQVKLVRSPYAIGYELNGLSDVGDWFQVVVTENWPGCNSGFEEVTEVWNSNVVSGPINCDPSVPLKAGDLVELNLSFDATHRACLSVSDLTTTLSHASCVTPPDSGGTQFVTLSSQASSSGYFTGPMTEVVNLTIASCPDYTRMPTVGYAFASPGPVTGVIPWSDEFEFGGNFTYCYGGGGGTYDLSGSSPVTSYLDTATGTSYGPRWAGVQNLSVLRPGFSLHYTTDPLPLTSVALLASASEVVAGDTVLLNISAVGGIPPYQGLFLLNGTPLGGPAATYSYRFLGTGTYSFTAYAVDSSDAAIGPSAPTVVTVPSLLVIWSIDASPASHGADVGQSVTFFANVTGGFGARTFAWDGLPAGCYSANSAQLTCTPAGPGISNISLRARDARGGNASSAPLAFRVSDALWVSLNVSQTIADVNQTLTLSASAIGGTGSYSYTWQNLPGGCLGTALSSITCRLDSPGSYLISVNVTDANLANSRSAATVLVVASQLSVALVSDRVGVDVGVSVYLTSAISGGSGGLSYNWVGLPDGCTASGLAVDTCVPTLPGTLALALTVTDQAGGEASSPVIDVAVYPTASVRLLASPSSVTLGETVTVQATVVGGGPSVRYVWSGLPQGCVADDQPMIVCAPSISGTFHVTLNVTDGAGAALSAQTIVVVGSHADPLALVGGIAGALLLSLVGVALAAGAYLAVSRRRASG